MMFIEKAKKDFIKQARKHFDEGAWLPWNETLGLEIGDEVTINSKHYDFAKHAFETYQERLLLNSLSRRTDSFGFTELDYSAKILNGPMKGGTCSGILSVSIPDEYMNMHIPKGTVLYEDDEVVFEKYDGKYRLSFFNEDNHWHGEIMMNRDGVIYDGIKDDSIEQSNSTEK